MVFGYLLASYFRARPYGLHPGQVASIYYLNDILHLKKSIATRHIYAKIEKQNADVKVMTGKLLYT